MLFAYTLVLYLSLPFVLIRLLFKSIWQPDYRKRLLERFGRLASTTKPCDIWFHAVSVGEVEAARSIIDALIDSKSICVTTTTPTGSKRVKDLYKGRVVHCYLPYDLPFAIRGFLKRVKPRLAIIMETEIWPNLYRTVAKHPCTLIMANARLSARSLKTYHWIKPVMVKTFGLVKYIACQSADDKARFLALGASPEQLRVFGNVKFDVELSKDEQEDIAKWQERFGNRPTLIAASTHEGEEKIVLTAFSKLKKHYPNALLLIAPRHPERCLSVKSLAENYRVAMRSQSMHERIDSDLFIIDTLGELMIFYGCADVAFVGGSLVPHGGHNVLEPILAGVPVISGPYMHNFNAIKKVLLAKGGLQIVDDANALSMAFIDFLNNEEKRRTANMKAQSVVNQNKGATKMHSDLISTLA